MKFAAQSSFLWHRVRQVPLRQMKSLGQVSSAGRLQRPCPSQVLAGRSVDSLVQVAAWHSVPLA